MEAQVGRKRPTKLRAVAAGTALSSIFVQSAPASANWSGVTGVEDNCSGQNNQADNELHTFAYVNVQSSMSQQLVNLRSQIDAAETVVSTLSVPLTDTTDAVVYDENYTTYCGFQWDGPVEETWGITQCKFLNGANACDRHETRFDTDNYLAGPTFRLHVACHEIGHSFGLLHRNDKCMTNTAAPTVTQYSAHDKAHWNNEL